MDIKWIILLGATILVPIITLPWLGQKIESFHTILKEEHCITGKRRVVNEKNLLFPSKVQAKLESMPQYDREAIQSIHKEQHKMIFGLISYGILGVMYWIVWLAWLKENQRSLETPSCAIFFLGTCLVVFHIFWTAPLLDFKHQREILGDKKLDLLRMMVDAAKNGPTSWLTRNSNYTILFVVALLATIIFQCIYLLFCSKFILNIENSDVGYVIALFILIVYQYIIQRGIAYFLGKSINRFILSKYVGQFAQYNLLYQLLKNATYLSYILLTIPLSQIDDSFTVSVIGTLFLIDTFFDKHDKLLKQLTDTQEPCPSHKPTSCTKCCAPNHYEAVEAGKREKE